MDIGSNAKYPAGALSNFTPRRFVFDGVECGSIEGVLQSFKFENIDSQQNVCTMVGIRAKGKGRKKKWFKEQKLHWNGTVYERDGEEYQELLNRLYQAVYDQCPKFRDALKATNKAVLTHSIGKNKKNETILTTQEFCSRLTKLRDTGKIYEEKQ